MKPFLEGLDLVALVANGVKLGDDLAAVQLFHRHVADLAVPGKLVALLEFLHGRLGLFAEGAGDIALVGDVAQLIEPLLHGLHVLALVAGLHDVGLGLRTDEHGVRLAADLAVAGEPVVALERLDRALGQRAEMLRRLVGIHVAEFHQPRLDGGDDLAVIALLEHFKRRGRGLRHRGVIVDGVVRVAAILRVAGGIIGAVNHDCVAFRRLDRRVLKHRDVGRRKLRAEIAADGGLRGCAAGGQRDDEDQYGNEHQAHPADAVPERARRQARQELIEPVTKALERLPGKRAQLFEQRDKNPANLFEQHPCPTPKAFHASTSPFLTVSISVRMEPVYQTTVSIP